MPAPGFDLPAGPTRAKLSRVANERHPTEFYRLTLRDDGIVWMERTLVPYPALEDVARGYDEAFALIDPWRKRMRKRMPDFRFGFVYDVRNSPPIRKDAAFEKVHHDYRPKLFARSPALVVLVETMDGMKQMNRLGHVDGSRFYATDDPVDAARYVLETLAKHAW